MTEAPQSKSIAPVVVGIVLTMVFLAALAYVANKRQSEQAAVPALEIVSPVSGASIDSPLVVTFGSSRPIELGPTGWGVAGLHLHAWVNDVQYMPAAADITAAGESRYRWSLPTVARGPLTIRLGWADAQHRPLSAGSTADVSASLK